MGFIFVIIVSRVKMTFKLLNNNINTTVCSQDYLSADFSVLRLCDWVHFALIAGHLGQVLCVSYISDAPHYATGLA